MSYDVNWSLLAKHFAGECTDDERAALEMWLSEDPDRQRLLDEAAEIWNAAAPAEASEHDVDALWSRLETHVTRSGRPTPQQAADRQGPAPHNERQRPTPESGRQRPAPQNDRPARRPERTAARRRRRSRLSGVALVLTVLVGAVAVTLWLNQENPAFAPSAADGKVFTTERGQRATIRLIDGTLVRLNAASTLTLWDSFGASERVVQLVGEGYFEVASDSSKPFTVEAGAATARALGTSFNVTAYPDEQQVRVVVAEGRVAFRGDAPADPESRAGEPAGENREVVLSASEMGELDDRGALSRSSTAVARHLDWIDGYLYFKDAPFQEVVRKISRWYDVDVVLGDMIAPAGHLNARFSDEQSLSDVLQVIATAFELEFEIQHGTVRFFQVESGRRTSTTGLAVPSLSLASTNAS